MTKEEAQTGTEVIYSGYEGIITEVLTGKLDGMVNIRLARGGVCTSIQGLKKVN